MRGSSMKRLHVHVTVADLDASIRFYSTLFSALPTVTQSDYAKWMLDDPVANFAISCRGSEPGLEHLGIQVENGDELKEVYDRLQQAGRPVLTEGSTTCCYSQSEKAWIADPQGVAWETFLTSGSSTVYGDSVDLGPIRTATSPRVGIKVAEPSNCCTPKVSEPCCLPVSDKLSAAAEPPLSLSKQIASKEPKMSETLPSVYLHTVQKTHGGDTGCDCEPPKKIDVQMRIENNTLMMNLFEYGVIPKLGEAADIAAVRIQKDGDQIQVFAIYRDPEKTASMACCHGGGCACYASGCAC